MKISKLEWAVRGLVWGVFGVVFGYGIYQSTQPSAPPRPSYLDMLLDKQGKACRDLFELNRAITGRPIPDAIITSPEDVAPQLRALHQDVC